MDAGKGGGAYGIGLARALAFAAWSTAGLATRQFTFFVVALLGNPASEPLPRVFSDR